MIDTPFLVEDNVEMLPERKVIIMIVNVFRTKNKVDIKTYSKSPKSSPICTSPSEHSFKWNVKASKVFTTFILHLGSGLRG